MDKKVYMLLSPHAQSAVGAGLKTLFLLQVHKLHLNSGDLSECDSVQLCSTKHEFEIMF